MYRGGHLTTTDVTEQFESLGCHSFLLGRRLFFVTPTPTFYDTIEEFNVDSKAECGQLKTP